MKLDEARSELKDDMYYNGDNTLGTQIAQDDDEDSNALLVLSQYDEVPAYYSDSLNTLEEAASAQEYKNARASASSTFTAVAAVFGGVLGVALAVVLKRRSAPATGLRTSEAAAPGASFDTDVSFV
jgi:hypothetical protein